jgi:hypothetical protein
VRATLQYAYFVFVVAALDAGVCLVCTRGLLQDVGDPDPVTAEIAYRELRERGLLGPGMCGHRAPGTSGWFWNDAGRVRDEGTIVSTVRSAPCRDGGRVCQRANVRQHDLRRTNSHHEDGARVAWSLATRVARDQAVSSPRGSASAGC